jgi:hypothetical protein
MRIEAIQGAGSSAREVMMEMWKMSMTQRLMHDMRQRVNGQSRHHSQDIMVTSVGSENIHSREDRDRPSVVPVEPAVKITISAEARAKLNTHIG